MGKRIVAALLSLALIAQTGLCFADGSEIWKSADWAQRVHEENSIAASVLFLPYIILITPVRIVQGIVNPEPKTLATVPPRSETSRP
jgi:hypothetical protein